MLVSSAAPPHSLGAGACMAARGSRGVSAPRKSMEKVDTSDARGTKSLGLRKPRPSSLMGRSAPRRAGSVGVRRTQHSTATPGVCGASGHEMAALLQLLESAQAQESQIAKEEADDDIDDRFSMASLDSHDEADLAIMSVLEEDFGGMVDSLLVDFAVRSPQADFVCDRVVDGSSISAARRTALVDLPLAALAAGQHEVQGRATDAASWPGSSVGTPREQVWTPRAKAKRAQAPYAASSPRPLPPSGRKASKRPPALAPSPRTAETDLPRTGRQATGGRPLTIVSSPSNSANGDREWRAVAVGSPMNLCRARRRNILDTPPGSPRAS